jgi:CBS domain-containing protein
MVFEATQQLLEGKSLGIFMDEKATELASVSKTATVGDALKASRGRTGQRESLCSRMRTPGADRLGHGTLAARNAATPRFLPKCARGAARADTSTSLAQVLDKLHVLSLPVVDEDGEYAGCISVGDVLRGLMKGAHLAHLAAESMRPAALPPSPPANGHARHVRERATAP